MTESNDIQHLVPALKQGSTDAYRELVRSMGEPLSRYAMQIVGDQGTAQDVVQDAFLRMYKRRKLLDESLELRGLCFRTVRNLARNHVRDTSLRKQREQEADGMRGGNDGPGALAQEAWERVKRLPAALREVIELRFAFGLSRSEIAATLEVPEGTVATRQKTALENLREQMKSCAPAIALPGLAELLGTPQPPTPFPDLNLEELVMNGIKSMKMKAALVAVSAVVIVLMLATTGGAIAYGMANDSTTPAQTIAADSDNQPGHTSSPAPRKQSTTQPGRDTGSSESNASNAPAVPTTPVTDQPVDDAPTSTLAPVQPAAQDADRPTDVPHQPAPDVAPSFLSEPVEIALAGQPYEYAVLATGNPAHTLTAEGLPPWLALEANTLRGTPANADQGLTDWLCLRANNGVAPAAEQRFRILITAAPAITSTAIGNAIVGTEYKYQLNATGTPAPTFTLSGGPSWLSLKGDTLVGTPVADDSGNAHELIVVADNGIKPSAEQRFTLTVAGPPRFTSKPVETVLAGVEYRYEIELAGSPEPKLTAKGLPKWLSLDGNVLSGKPRNADVGNTGKITLTASNKHKPDAEQTFTIAVAKNAAYVELPWTLKDLKKFYKVGVKWVLRDEGRKHTASGVLTVPLSDYEVTEVNDAGVTVKHTHRMYQTATEKAVETEIVQDLKLTWEQLLEGCFWGVAVMKPQSCTEVKEPIGGKTQKCWLIVYEVPKGTTLSDLRVWVLEDKPGIAAKEQHTYPQGPRIIHDLESFK